ncbi:MAG: hypothetical protein HYU58_00930 [Proteobacteria bacterium]|nr:hypothetical protein [Pseudomonadota bacterium]
MTDAIETPDSALDSLRALLAREIEAVGTDQIGSLRDNARAKNTITKMVRAEMGAAFATLAERAKTEDAPDFVALRDGLSELAVLAERHRRVLASAIDATRERINVVVEARRRAAATHETYGANGRLCAGTPSRQSMMISSTRI